MSAQTPTAVLKVELLAVAQKHQAVPSACGIRLKRSVTDGRVGAASGVVNQCERLACFVPVVLNKSAPRQWPCFRLQCWQAARGAGRRVEATGNVAPQ
jgi:hypothetical protein